MLLQEATSAADVWKDVNCKYDDRRRFPRFLSMLQDLGLDWHKYVSNEAPYPNLTSDANWVMAKKYHDITVSLMQLLQRIQSESGNDFSREQKQRDVAYGFSQHLEQLRKSAAAAAGINCSNAAVDNGDMERQQKHLFDSLYIMSRESTWLLKKPEASHPSSPSFIEESHRILESIVLFLSRFKKSKKMKVLRNERLLDDFGKRIRDIQEKGVGRKSAAEMLLECFVDVVNKVERHYYYRAKLKNPSDTSSFGQDAFSKAAKKTSEMINEASCVVNLRLDLICEKHNESMKLGALSDTVTNVQILDQLSASIDQLLTAGESVLYDFVAMHKTMAEITYMLGDAFTTGGAGMNELNDKAMEMDFDLDFPWDKHNIPDEVEKSSNLGRIQLKLGNGNPQ
ncbi:hypothetical protein MKW94_003652 [Papaver nudicaule]|uniref:Uncharacterized protein n=1 Tax=Papaver nudicaule TaxID=74823 RepID=A0AA41W2K0_PAPNU|nr:hypothetical protein [Papaver nudicaule]